MPRIASKRPLTEKEQQDLVILLEEAKARGITLPKNIKTLVQDKKQAEWPRDENGYFIRMDGHRYNPSDAHKGFIESTARNVMIYGPRGCGKALDISTPIPTPRGWKVMADIRVGDWVFDETGSPCKVIAVSEMMFGHKCYDVVFDDDSVITADAEHEWTTLTSKDRKNKDGEGKLRIKRGKLVPRTGEWSYQDFTTEEIKNSLISGKETNHSIDLSMPIILPDSDLGVPPYVMGLWLGDGKSSGANITIGDEDIDAQHEILFDFGISLKHYGQYQYGMILHEEISPVRNPDNGRMESNPNSLYGMLKSYGVLDNKHIPIEYSRASYRQRLELLQGLMDSDGTIRPDGACEFCTTSRRLAEGFYDLCMTLGIKVSMKEGVVKFLGRDFGRFRFVFVPYVPVFRLPRKLNRIKNAGSQSNRRFRRYIVDVREVESVPVKCITVDSMSHLYLAGPSYIPTHNSGAGSQKAMRKIMQGEKGLIMNPDFENLKISTWPEFKQWIPWKMVVPSQRHRENDAWQPSKPFTMNFINGSIVYIKGGKEAGSTRGPNVNWFWLDEGGRDETGLAWQIANASVRVGNLPQAWCTETPRPTEHWSYKFFIEQDIPQELKDEFEKIVGNDRILIEYFHATREDNKANLDATYYINLALNYPSGHLRAQEFDGEFANEGGKIGDATWFKNKILQDAPRPSVKRVRFWDLAATEKKVIGIGKKKELNDPDESVGSLVSSFLHEWEEDGKHKKDTNWCIEDQVGGFWEWDDLLEAIVRTARLDGPLVPIVLEEEPGSGGKNQVAAVKTHLKRFPDLLGHQVIGQKARDVGDRVMAANHWFALAANGKMWLVKGMWNEKFLGQLDGFTQVMHDDRVTSVTGAMVYIRPFKAWVRTPFISL